MFYKIRFQRLFTWVFYLEKMIVDEEKLIIINPELPRKNDEQKTHEITYTKILSKMDQILLKQLKTKE